MIPEVRGQCDPRFQRMEEIFAHNFDEGLELGASLAVTLEGELVLDLWGGYQDLEKTRAWQEDTLTIVFSSTKFATNLCAYVLIDQGRLQLDARIADYWPEFASKGKDKVLVKHIFNHTTGVPGYDPPIPFATQYDWEAITTALAQQELWWEPGTQSGYHADTYGVLVGELVRRISGQTLGQFLKSEITSKIGAEFQIGLDPLDAPRCAGIDSTGFMSHREGPLGAKVRDNLTPPDWDIPACILCEMPSSNGMTNARSMAQLSGMMAMNGEFNGQRILSPETIDLVLTETLHAQDAVVGETIRWGLGVGLNSAEFECLGEGSLHWGGAGGSMILADRDYKVSMAYAMNKMMPAFGDDPRVGPLRSTFMEIVRGL
jgi:CubicO group peptidase (beta-lactamase class C family)